MNILGISAFYHDSAAALLHDGDIVAAAQEERFTREKGDSSYPEHAVSFCLCEAGITHDQLDCVVFYEKPLVKFERLFETYLAGAPGGFRSFQRSLPVWARRKLRIPEYLRSRFGQGFRGELLFADHHESHAASAFFPSPFEEAAILTLDAVGEWSTSSLGVGKGNKVELLEEMRFPHSLGMLYSAFTYYTGFKVNSGEYKMMGLAPYGEPKYVDVILDKLVDVKDDGSLWMDMSYFNYCHGLTMTSEKFHQLFGGPPRKSESWVTRKDMDLAASIQVVCEEVVLRAAHHAHSMTGMRHVVMAGGVALNCVSNGRLLREGPFDQVWIQPAAGDAGGALGAAFVAWHHVLGRPRSARAGDSQKGSLLGPAFEDAEIGLYLDSLGARYQHIQDEGSLLDYVAGALAEGSVIGWFQGRMEYGPRSLGCRSILGDPRSPSLQQTMNLKIKFRESFRPFAPCILRECIHHIVDMKPGEDSPYMLLVATVRDELKKSLTAEERERLQDPDLRIRVAVPRSTVPAVTHVDYSARIQTVDEERHGRFYRLIKRFYELTDCPALINTSFNIRGEPIVCTPEDAFRCFMATDMDCLVLENYIVRKDEQHPGLLEYAQAYQTGYALD